MSTLPTRTPDELNRMTVNDLKTTLKGVNVQVPSKANKRDLINIYLRTIGAPTPTVPIATTRASRALTPQNVPRQHRAPSAKTAGTPRTRAVAGAPGLQGMTVAQMKDELRRLGQSVPANPRREELIERLVGTGRFQAPPTSTAPSQVRPSTTATLPKGTTPRSRVVVGATGPEGMTVKQMQELLRSRGQPYQGTRAELIERVRNLSPSTHPSTAPTATVVPGPVSISTPQPHISVPAHLSVLVPPSVPSVGVNPTPPSIPKLPSVQRVQTPPPGEIPLVPLNLPPLPAMPSVQGPTPSMEGPLPTQFRPTGLSPLRGSQHPSNSRR